MGEAEAYREERPVTQTCVDDFEIAATEVTNAQFQAFVDATGYETRAERGWRADEPGGPGIDVPAGSAVFQQPTQAVRALTWWRLVEGASWRAPHGPDATSAPNPGAPVVHVTQADAAAYAAWAGGRLPTEAEWEYAARGGVDGALMAWDEAEAGARAARANTWQGVFPVVNLNQDGHADLAPAASYPANGFGLYDMIGNAWEWTATPYAPDHTPEARARAAANGLDPTQPGVPVGVIKGGSYLCAPNYCARFRPAARQAQDLAFGTSHIGFRIVRDVP